MAKPSGYVIYRGPSQLDGAPIVAILTVKTDNRKTGDMLQTWILRADLGPVDASKAGADASVCGDCPQRWSLGGACYVNLGQGPRSVYAAYTRGRYPDAILQTAPAAGGYRPGASTVAALVAGRRVRLGAYGDPAAVPADIWRALVAPSAGHTGYTHQWRNPVARELRELCMASVDSAAEWADAQRDGWRTFRVTGPAELLEPGEIECASDARGISCADCMACDGAQRGNTGQVSIAITVHGPRVIRFHARPVATAGAPA